MNRLRGLEACHLNHQETIILPVLCQDQDSFTHNLLRVWFEFIVWSILYYGRYYFYYLHIPKSTPTFRRFDHATYQSYWRFNNRCSTYELQGHDIGVRRTDKIRHLPKQRQLSGLCWHLNSWIKTNNHSELIICSRWPTLVKAKTVLNHQPSERTA